MRSLLLDPWEGEHKGTLYVFLISGPHKAIELCDDSGTSQRKGNSLEKNNNAHKELKQDKKLK